MSPDWICYYLALSHEAVSEFSPAGDLIFEVYLEKRVPEQCCLIKVSPSMRPSELAETVLSMKNTTFKADDLWTTFEVLENGELERPLHHNEKILEQVLEWSTLECPSSAFLLIKKFPGGTRMASDKDHLQCLKGDYLKFNDGSSKLLPGHKFQDKYVTLGAEKLLLYRDIKNTKAEKTIPLKTVKCYLGLKKKLKPPTNWGFTVYTDKQQWHFCCDKRETQVSWVTDIIAAKFGSDLHSKGTSDLQTFRGRAVTDCTKVPLYNDNYNKQVFPQLMDRRISLGDGNSKTTKVPELPFKSLTIPKSPKLSDLHKTKTIPSSPIPSDISKARTLPNNPKPTDMYKTKTIPHSLKTPELPYRRTSVDVTLPHQLPSLSLSRHMQPMPLPTSPQSRSKALNKRPFLGGEGVMPPNLINELNSVLSKTGCKNSD